MDGVVKAFAVVPYAVVAVGQLLFSLDDVTLRGKVELSERTLDVARAEYHQVSQSAFSDRRGGVQLATLEAQVQLREAELAFSRLQMERATVTAPRSGVVIFTDPRDWIGRPVVTGERILSIADPTEAEVKIMVAVEDGQVLREGAEVLVFLDTDPLHPVPARLVRAAYEAEVTPAGVLAYRGVAAFTGTDSPPRLGLQATAKIYGERVTLALYLFRRPLTALRRFIGF
ncbi:hypothetical protein WCLP8_5420001 [uncultured Gammaproteobacteria bacterium]